MQNILVPIDYSTASKGSLEYSCELSQSLKANVIVLNVMEGEKTTEEGSKKLKRFIKGYPNKFQYRYQRNENIQSLLKKGDIIDCIVETAIEKKVDLIILGTRKKHGVKDYLFLLHLTMVFLLLMAYSN